MSLTLTQATLDEIQRLFNIAKDRHTNYADVYAYIRDTISGLPQSFPEVDSVARWFTVATDANGDVGPASVLIRSFTQRQGDLRGVDISAQDMQDASNAVAFNAITDILSRHGGLPTIEDIARQDATGVGDTLFIDQAFRSFKRHI
jgi:hypothetical protein